MSLEADLMLDRTRLKRRLGWWRLFAVLFAIGLVALAIDRTRPAGGLFARDHVARLRVDGAIAQDRELSERIAEVAKDPTARALIVSINSPGGTAAGGESLHRAIAKVAAQKPVVAVMGDIAASAGFMVALPAERVFAQATTLTGSIGVILVTTEVSGLLDTLGIKTEQITSGALKGQPSPVAPLTEPGRAMLTRLIAATHDEFVRLVVEGRKLPEADVRAIADGRVMTGREALSLKLVDALGGEDDARAWLASAKGVPDSLPVRDVTDQSDVEGLLSSTLSRTWKSILDERLKIDGLWAIWQR